jgi:hypothetical protein
VFAVLMMIEQRRGQGGAYGGVQWHCVGRGTSDKKTNNQKYGMTIDGRRLMTLHTATNQKYTSAIKRVYERRCNQGGACRGDDTIVLGGIRS